MRTPPDIPKNHRSRREPYFRAPQAIAEPVLSVPGTARPGRAASRAGLRRFAERVVMIGFYAPYTESYVKIEYIISYEYYLVKRRTSG
jgi:hypothetical protein